MAVVNAVTQVAEVGATAANVSLLHDNAEEGRVSAAWVDEDDAGLKVCCATASGRGCLVGVPSLTVCI